jgi:hypothetical protein
MHACAATWLKDLLQLPNLLLNGDDKGLALALNRAAAGIDAFTSLLTRDLPNVVDPVEFYDTYRPLLNGFHGGLGVVLRLDLQNRPGTHDLTVHAKGPSAGQSTLFLLLDLALGLKHAPCTEDNAKDAAKEDAAKNTAVATNASPPAPSPMAAFQREMLAYMPTEHRALALAFADALHATGYGSAAGYLDCRPQAEASRSSTGSGVGGGSSRPAVRRAPAAVGPWARTRRLAARAALAKCGQSLAAMRRAHLSVAGRYLAARGATTGTGATSFGQLLGEALANTAAAAAAAAPAAGTSKPGKPKRE